MPKNINHFGLMGRRRNISADAPLLDFIDSVVARHASTFSRQVVRLLESGITATYSKSKMIEINRQREQLKNKHKPKKKAKK